MRRIPQTACRNGRRSKILLTTIAGSPLHRWISAMHALRPAATPQRIIIASSRPLRPIWTCSAPRSAGHASVKTSRAWLVSNVHNISLKVSLFQFGCGFDSVSQFNQCVSSCASLLRSHFPYSWESTHVPHNSWLISPKGSFLKILEHRPQAGFGRGPAYRC